MDLGLEGRTAVVTGASRGIGRAIAEAMVEAGADVVGLGRRWDLGLARVNFRTLTADLRDDAQLRAAVGEAGALLGRFDILVNAAGVTDRTVDSNVTAQMWDDVFAVNVRAPFLLSQLVAARMLAGEGGGVILNLASLAAQTVTGAPTVYASSKAAVVQMTRVLAVRWAPAIRVNAIGPGYVRTDLNSTWLGQPGNERYVLEHTPLKRLGQVGDIASAAVFLVSPAASFITGQHVLVDGGWSTQ